MASLRILGAQQEAPVIKRKRAGKEMRKVRKQLIKSPLYR